MHLKVEKEKKLILFQDLVVHSFVLIYVDTQVKVTFQQKKKIVGILSIGKNRPYDKCFFFRYTLYNVIYSKLFNFVRYSSLLVLLPIYNHNVYCISFCM